jgi:diamine N-acetyltransferase
VAARVSLREVTPENRAAVEALRVAPEQEPYVSSVSESLAEAVEQPDGQPWIRAVYGEDVPVGFVMLSDNVRVSDPRYPWRYFLWKLLIDARFQRRGYGTATVDAVVEVVRGRPGADALHTSAVPGDASPVGFYERYGFVRTGQIFDDEVVLRLDLAPRDR